jgi:hypothetical protein
MPECKRCKAEIDPERLEVLPETEICTKCSKAIGGEVKLYVGLENSGKAGSLKKNYGGVNLTAVKKRIIPLDEKPFGEMD